MRTDIGLDYGVGYYDPDRHDPNNEYYLEAKYLKAEEGS